MQLKTPLTLLFVACFIITACSETLFAPLTSTPTATQTDTPVPTRTISPTATPTPINTFSLPTLAPTFEIRTGTPVADWRGIPIMPHAITGEEHRIHYAFTTKASLEEVRDYYIRTMQSRGWKNVEDYYSISPGEKYTLVSSNNFGGYRIYLSSVYEWVDVFNITGDITYVMIFLDPVPATPTNPAYQ